MILIDRDDVVRVGLADHVAFQVEWEVGSPEAVEAGPFRVQFLPLAHSIPESSALVIDTPATSVEVIESERLARSRRISSILPCECHEPVSMITAVRMPSIRASVMIICPSLRRARTMIS